MLITRRVYVSLPADIWLDDQQNRLKWGIVDEIAKLGYTPEIFHNPRGQPGLASAKSWSPELADEIARRCCGAVILGMPRWHFGDGDGNSVVLPTEFNHYEGALARTLGLPILVLVQRDVRNRGVFDFTFGGYLGRFPSDADVSWLHTDDFKVPFGYWKAQMDERHDLFLGYCGSSTETAAAVKQYLQWLGVRVLDWRTDFLPGRSIIEQIEAASARSTGGVFLFTKDDDLADESREDSAVPRDNVVFEAGYFIGRKGKHNVLIVRESGSKMPADLGGDIYAALPDRTDISPIHRTLRAFVGAL
jgi:hypothetical protein